MRGSIAVAFLITASWLAGGVRSAQYYGKFLGKLSELHHGVSGEVYAVDGRTLYLKDFTYDGQGPAAYFYASTGKNANSAGFRLRDENGRPDVIRKYRKEGVTLTLPEGKTLNNIKIFYVWCEEFEVNFGDVKIPRSFDYPRPQKIEPLKGVHAISSDNIVIVDAQTLLIPNLSYDGEAPDAKFWVGRGPKPSPQGIRVPDENGKEVPLRRYDRKTVVLTLPGDLTVFDIGHFGIWCEAFTVDFAHVKVPQTLNIPPSLRMLGVSPQSKLNCEVLYDDLAFEVRWAVAGDSIVLQLVAKLDDNEYMSFGISGDDSKSVMINGDVVVAWVDKKTLKGYAEDYFLDAKAQCSGPSGSCPDNRLADHTNNIRLLNAAMVNGYSIVTYQRPLKPSDEFDRQIFSNRSQPIIWAIGPLNQRNEVSFHSHYTKGDRFLDFGRAAKWNCPMPETEQPMKAIVQAGRPAEESQPATTTTTTTTVAPARTRNSERRRGASSSNRNNSVKQQDVAAADSERSTTKTRQSERRGATRGAQRTSATKTVPTPAPAVKTDAWEIPPIQCYEPEDGVFYAQMGPTGGKHGYPAITGHVGWGISWYINGLLIPEINVVRGKTYTFVVEGGFDPEIPAKYHPFYITDDPIGGYEYKTEEEKKNVRIFSGAIFAKDGSAKATGTGRLCHWTQQGDHEADDFESFGAFQRTLELKCDQGEPGVIQWTPDRNTPDTVYYQCFTHRYLGWKINVLDSCDVAQPAASELEPVVVPAPETSPDLKLSPDLETSPSQTIETRVKPNDIISDDKERKDVSTVSELSTSTTPLVITPQHQLPIEPTILIQPQQSFFNHHPSLYMSQGPFFAPNPYILESPIFLNNPYKRPNTFRPSPPLDKDGFEPKSTTETAAETTTVIASTTTAASTTSTTTTTERTTTPTTSEKPMAWNFSEKSVLMAAADTLNKTFLLPPPFLSSQNFVMRRPMVLPPKHRVPKPRPVYMRPHAAPHYKKFMHRPSRPVKKNKPIYFSEMTKRRPTYIVWSPPTKATSTTPMPTVVVPTVRNVEISPLQASTEREPDIQTASPTSESFTAPSSERYHVIKMPLALNTGFHPDSVVVESGFKPIVSKDFERRMSEDEEPETEFESEIGVIDVTRVDEAQRLPQNFEPMFVPSPVDKPPKRNKHKKFQGGGRGRSLQNQEPLIEPIPAAAERVESFYLPPLGKPLEFKVASQQSSIDIEPPYEIDLGSPPDVVVTYDGKKVSGQSLTAKVPIERQVSVLDQRISKAAQLIRARPQFAPFKGELPPLDPAMFNTRNVPQLQSRRGLISRGLDAPALSSGSTKLRPVDDDGNNKVRRARAAHHTPEHTAEQQEKRRNDGGGGGAAKGGCSRSQFSFHAHVVSTVTIAFFLKFLIN